MPEDVIRVAPPGTVRWRDAVLSVRLHCRLHDGETSRDVPHEAEVIAAIDDGTDVPRFLIRPVRSR